MVEGHRILPSLLADLNIQCLDEALTLASSLVSTAAHRSPISMGEGSFYRPRNYPAVSRFCQT
jgi:hypothetical protein